MNFLRGALSATLLSSISIFVCASANNADSGCFTEEVEAHVQQQFAIFGPLSKENEYFGFIYRQDGVIDSAVTRGSKCPSGNCVVDTAAAARLIPAAGEVLGEWHTHPHNGAMQLSEIDVRGANQNRHLECYTAYYSKPNGEILAWNPGKTSVPTAMASRVRIGNYYPEHSATLARNDSARRRS